LLNDFVEYGVDRQRQVGASKKPPTLAGEYKNAEQTSCQNQNS
jgi:hypothetical protein